MHGRLSRVSLRVASRRMPLTILSYVSVSKVRPSQYIRGLSNDIFVLCILSVCQVLRLVTRNQLVNYYGSSRWLRRGRRIPEYNREQEPNARLNHIVIVAVHTSVPGQGLALSWAWTVSANREVRCKCPPQVNSVTRRSLFLSRFLAFYSFELQHNTRSPG